MLSLIFYYKTLPLISRTKFLLNSYFSAAKTSSKAVIFSALPAINSGKILWNCVIFFLNFKPSRAIYKALQCFLLIFQPTSERINEWMCLFNVSRFFFLSYLLFSCCFSCVWDFGAYVLRSPYCNSGFFFLCLLFFCFFGSSVFFAMLQFRIVYYAVFVCSRSVCTHNFLWFSVFLFLLSFLPQIFFLFCVFLWFDCMWSIELVKRLLWKDFICFAF